MPARLDDRTTSARIRDAAISCFAEDGVNGTSVRTIAAAAGVSPALVIHHFGSKDALREACDDYVAATVRQNKSTAMAAGPGLDPLAAMRQSGGGPPIMKYLARTLGDGTPAVADLIDELVDDAVQYMQDGVDNGVLTPTDDPRGRATVLTMWSLGALVLHEHVERLLGVDLTLGPEELAEVGAPYFSPALDLLGNGVIAPEIAERLRTAFASSTDHPLEGA